MSVSEIKCDKYKIKVHLYDLFNEVTKQIDTPETHFRKS